MRVAVVLLLLVSFFASPIADDYAYAVRTLQLDYWSALVKEYHTWNGRWASNLILLLNEQILENIWVYRLCVALNLVVLYISMHLAFPKIAKYLFVIYLASAAAFSENFYWFTGAVTYTTAISLQLIAISLFIKKRNWFLAVVLLCISSGFNELCMAINLILAIVFFPLHKNRVILIALAAVSVFMILAPGNAVRGGNFTNNHQIFYSLYMSLAQTIRFSAKAIFFLPLPLCMIWIYSKNLSMSVLSKVKIWQLVGLAFLPLFLSAFLPYWATGILGQHRTPAVGQFYFVAACLLLPIWLKTNYPSVIQIQPKVRRLSLSGMVLGFLLLGNTGEFIRNFASGSIQKNSKLQKARIETIENNCDNGLSTLTFQPLDTNALFVIDISENPNHWINIHQSNYLCPEANLSIQKKSN